MNISRRVFIGGAASAAAAAVLPASVTQPKFIGIDLGSGDATAVHVWQYDPDGTLRAIQILREQMKAELLEAFDVSHLLTER